MIRGTADRTTETLGLRSARWRRAATTWVLAAVLLWALSLAAVHGNDDCPISSSGCPVCVLAQGVWVELPTGCPVHEIVVWEAATHPVLPAVSCIATTGWHAPRAPPPCLPCPAV